MDRKGYSALRRYRSFLPGQTYLLTTVCRGRMRLFAEPPLARIVAGTLSDPRPWFDAQILAWVLMPDHWHGRVQLGSGRSLSAPMQRAKANASRDATLAFGVPAPWQAGFHERMVRSDVDLRVLARYVIAIPFARAWSTCCPTTHSGVARGARVHWRIRFTDPGAR